MPEISTSMVVALDASSRGPGCERPPRHDLRCEMQHLADRAGPRCDCLDTSVIPRGDGRASEVLDPRPLYPGVRVTRSQRPCLVLRRRGLRLPGCDYHRCCATPTQSGTSVKGGPTDLVYLVLPVVTTPPLLVPRRLVGSWRADPTVRWSVHRPDGTELVLAP